MVTDLHTQQALSRLAYLFQGTWGLSDSTGKELNGGASPSIAIRKYYAKNGQGITLTAFVGLLELGDLSAYIAAEDLERTCHKIGPCLKTTFVWLTSPNEEGRPQEGTLDVFFNGCKIDGYLSGVSFERPVAFQGMLQPKNFTPKQAKEESRSLWEAFCSIRTSMKHHSEHTGLQHTSGEIENGTAH